MYFDIYYDLYSCALFIRQKLILGETKRYSDHPYDLHTGMVVMLNHTEDGVWYRAIVTDPCVKDEVIFSPEFSH